VRTFHFPGPEGSAFSSDGTRGRATVVLFVTTYDLSSQFEARQLSAVVRRFRPRINAGAVVLEAPQYSVLVSAFAASMELVYPVVMADRATLSGHGAFGEIRGVPTLVVLNELGREIWRREGATTVAELEEALAMATRRRNASSQ
jgi:hypothetical protein